MRDDYQRARSEMEKADRRRVILDAAEAQLLACGWRDFTIGSVASRAGIGKGTLYLYFETKEAVLDAVTLRHVTTWSSAVLEATHEGMTDAEFCRVYWDCTESDLVLTMALMSLPGDFDLSDEQAYSMVRARVSALTPLATHVEQCLGLPRGAGGQVLTGLWALMSGLARQDLHRIKPQVSEADLPGDVAGLWRAIDSERMFMRFAPAVVASTRCESGSGASLNASRPRGSA